jgi:hypothetical protein
LNKTQGVLASGASVKKYCVTEVGGDSGAVPGCPGIGATPYKAVGAACPPGRFGYASLHRKMATLALWGVDETTVLRTVVEVEDALLGSGQFSLPGRGP